MQSHTACDCPICSGAFDALLATARITDSALNASAAVRKARNINEMVKALVVLRAHVENSEFNTDEAQNKKLLGIVTDAVTAARALQEARTSEAALNIVPLIDAIYVSCRDSPSFVAWNVSHTLSSQFGRSLFELRNPKGVAAAATTTAATTATAPTGDQ